VDHPPRTSAGSWLLLDAEAGEKIVDADAVALGAARTGAVSLLEVVLEEQVPGAELSPNSTTLKSGSCSLAMSNVTTFFDPAPVGLFTTKQWNAAAGPAALKASAAMAKTAKILRRMLSLPLPRYPAPTARAVPGSFPTGHDPSRG
jgi:hypothetical protein